MGATPSISSHSGKELISFDGHFGGTQVLNYFTMFSQSPYWLTTGKPSALGCFSDGVSLLSPINTLLPRLPCKERPGLRPQSSLDLRQVRTRAKLHWNHPLYPTRIGACFRVLCFHQPTTKPEICLLIIYPKLPLSFTSHIPSSSCSVDCISLKSLKSHMATIFV